ncbi:hypothetical protein AAFF_G00358210 [Aldrovandia affinis]|uniref:Cilia- and flagella-associated protein 97 n=1 Tax=Aldrovandia affinis TaxID=143900 RepID=A0AAD7X1B4_9TELE|nr:hypothetical protein AAFF_G00358210 [Aldrovandia affinis]
MYSPKELEGEVDHSFFDSDCDEHGKERGDNTNISGGITDAQGQVECEVTGEGNSSLSNEVKGSVDEDRSRPSSTSSLLSFEEQSEAGGRLDKNPSSHLQITAKIHTGLSPGENREDNDEDVDEDGYKRSEEESEEEPDQKPPRCKAVHHSLPKKSGGKFRSGKHSPSSSSKSESSYSSTEDSSDSSDQRKPAYISPVQSFELALGKEGKRESVIVRQQNVLGGLGIGPAEDESMSEDFMNLEKKLEMGLVMESPSRRMRKNYSFSNEEVGRINRENHRLLRELTRRTPRPKSAAPKKPTSPPVRLYHSALNRQREQQRIERENMAFLKRLESAKPTTGMRRAEQLSDYQRQASYLGTTSPSKLERSPSSRSSACKSSRVSSASSLHRVRPASGVSTAVSKTSRTAWP